jgi:hypothetical protein
MDMDEAQDRGWRKLLANERRIALLMESPEWADLSAERQAEIAAFHNELVAWMNVAHIQMDQMCKRIEAFRTRLRIDRG